MMPLILLMLFCEDLLEHNRRNALTPAQRAAEEKQGNFILVAIILVLISVITMHVLGLF